jgi:TolB-like protein
LLHGIAVFWPEARKVIRITACRVDCAVAAERQQGRCGPEPSCEFTSVFAIDLVSVDTFNEPELLEAIHKPSESAVGDRRAVEGFRAGDPEQEYFADGMVEDIIAALSHFKSLFVIARNSSFTYKGKAVDIKQVGRELGVRYVLEGSVRKAGGRVRIAGQLIDSKTGAHLWADRFDGALEDVFELQDKVTTSVVGQIFSQVQLQEEERAIRKPTDNLDAYDYYLRGTAKYWGWNRESTEAALALFTKAIELDENFALAHAFTGTIFALRKQSRWMVDIEKENAIAVHHARYAIQLGREDALALVFGGFTLATRSLKI